MPKVGDYQIILNSQDVPVAIIQSTHIAVYPFKDVPVEFALSEGQGTYEQWKKVHIQFFSQLLEEKECRESNLTSIIFVIKLIKP